MTVWALEVRLTYAPSKRLALLITHDRSREQAIVASYEIALPETARSARLSYQQRVAVNHQLSSH